MKVQLNDQTLIIGWQYESPRLEKLLAEKGLTLKDAKLMRKVDLIELLGLKHLPKPTVTHCILKRGDPELKDEQVTVKKFPDDPWDQNKARYFSLKKLVDTNFPGRENKGIRTNIWNTYNKEIGYKYFNKK